MPLIKSIKDKPVLIIPDQKSEWIDQHKNGIIYTVKLRKNIII